MPNKAAMLAADKRQLEQWQRKHLPNFHDTATQAVISWLLQDQGQVKQLRTLYETQGYGDGALRGVISLLAFHGLVDIARDRRDARRFTAQPTQTLIARMRQYAENLRQLIQRDTLLSSSSVTRSSSRAAADRTLNQLTFRDDRA